MPMPSIPYVHLPNNKKMPLVGMGLASFPVVDHETAKLAILQAIEVGYRHFDTASSFLYKTEQPLGEAIKEALALGLIESRDDLFITSKLWCSDNHPGHVLPAIRRTLQNLQLDYVDLYIIHFPVSLKPEVNELDIKDGDLVPFELESVWQDMEECQKLGLAKAIGVSNFSCKKLASVLAVAKIPPVVNQVEMNPVWQQKKMRELCKENEIVVVAYSPLGAKGALWGTNKVMECKVLHDIAKAKGKTVAQICIRWVYEQGVCVLVKSFNKERMKENLQIFGWELRPEESKRISEIPQSKGCVTEFFTSPTGPNKTVEELWDGEV